MPSSSDSTGASSVGEMYVATSSSLAVADWATGVGSIVPFGRRR